MIVLISLLRGVNVGGHQKIKMDALRALYESLGLRDARTYVQSGNVIFKTRERDIARLTQKIESAIERQFVFRPDVLIRTASELRDVVRRNPFAQRRGIDPSKLLVTFLARIPKAEDCVKVSQIKADPEELRIVGREVYIYYPKGMARPKLSWTQLAKTLKTTGTGRNWNTVTQLLAMAEELEATPPE
ncbi:MAG TPA: DUF1697 domain-containing protein [Terriglobia bacterium]|nr:DUF1697 domain-containing protein [Terriglobia bacterium]